ncbi:helix-turn-helix transcriptional regulator [Aureimonas jatrophae]|uniref:DNA-binding transcriptional regulator, XRE-family HTH domain n=1 Tax=Aureimonas jatrophae TaxID=1166073 RepID=A0A1H0F983_9HYPH|nr:helix-turn-helix transcriptional regulator [Aureimonas jatrophae]MBB3950117.1 transcriptional regulator with XRE-family HTH domain [Aureimonas jatrophae]SDN91267.1 DNA-binding transcriptional regulator, XRE-family HTH domain [Aureimonas jatrophae]
MNEGNGPGAVARGLRSLREAHALGCGELAACIGVTPESLRAIETGETLPSAAVLLRLSAFFAVEPAYFFDPASSLPIAGPGEASSTELDHLDGLVDEDTLELLAALDRSARKLKG